MQPAFAAAQAVIRAAFGEPILYEGAGLPAPTTLSVIWSDVAGDAFAGPGNTTRTISCEIDKGDLPVKPAKTDSLTRSGVVWKPNQVASRDDVNAWVVVLERAA